MPAGKFHKDSLRRPHTWCRLLFVFRESATTMPAFATLALLIVLAAIVQPKALTLPILMIVLRQAVPLALLALGQSLPIVGRSIDLSVGGVVALVNVLLALSFFHTGPAWFSLLMPLILGATIGALNACFIVCLRASAVVVTLGMSIVLTGASYLISGGAPGGQVHGIVKLVAMTRLKVFPVAVFAVLASGTIVWVMLNRLVFGKSLQALGSSYKAAWLAGLPVNRSLFVAHISCGALAGIAGIMLTGYIGTGTLNLGAELVLASVAAVVLGGINFGGGRGGIVGVALGAFCLTYLGTLLTSMGIEQPFQLVLQGAIVAAAAAIAQRKLQLVQPSASTDS